MPLSTENQEFEKTWLADAKEICQRILDNSEIRTMKDSFRATGFLTVEQQSSFIGVCNKIKYDYIYEKYGKSGTPEFEQFNAHWKAWFNDKGSDTASHWGKRLSNEEHIIFGSTPEPEQFLA